MSSQKVWFMHDGAIDELMSLILLTTMPDVTIESIDILNADCLGYPTREATIKILTMLGRTSDNVYVSNARGWNPFPWTYRQYAMMVNLLPMVNQYQGNIDIPEPPANPGLKERLIEAQAGDDNKKFTMLCLSPLTDIAEVIETYPKYQDVIDSIIWMGGVYARRGQKRLPIGNVDTGLAPGANPNAEWNAYWDPKAVQTVLQAELDFYMFPLNVTNNVFLTPDIIRKYFLPESRQYPMLDLVTQMYAMVAFQTGFSFWDTVTTAYLGNPDLFKMTTMNMSVDLSNDPAKQGTMYLDDVNGHPVNVITNVYVEGFYDYLVEQLKTISLEWY